MITSLSYLFLVLAVTGGIGLAFLSDRIDSLTRLCLSFPLGFTIISFAGIVAELLNLDVFTVQAAVAVCSLAYLFVKKGAAVSVSKGGLRVPITIVVVYMLLCLVYLEGIPAWASGDMEMHALRLKLFLDSGRIPLSIYPFGSYWEYYPKAFYFFCYFWINVLPMSLVETLKIVPVAVTGFSSMVFYGLARQFADDNTSKIAFIFATFLFASHYAYLIWGGYPAASGEMMLLALFLAFFTDRKLSLAFFASVLVTHTAYTVYLAVVLGVWLVTKTMAVRRFSRKRATYIAVGGVIAVSGALALGFGHAPVFFGLVVSQPFESLKYLLLWGLGVIAVPSTWKAVSRQPMKDMFFLSWLLGLLVLAFIIDAGIIDTTLVSVDRILITLYMPLSYFSALTFKSLPEGLRYPKTQRYVNIVLIVAGVLLFSSVFIWYIHNWGLPQPDYEAIQWLSQQEFKATAVFNMDPTGRWVWPLAGLQVSDPKESYRRPVWYGIGGEIGKGPMRKGTIRYMDEMRENYTHVLVYLSNYSTSNPGARAPFLRNNEAYSKLSPEDFLPSHYQVIYSKDGTYIFEYKGAI